MACEKSKINPKPTGQRGDEAGEHSRNKRDAKNWGEREESGLAGHRHWQGTGVGIRGRGAALAPDSRGGSRISVVTCTLTPLGQGRILSLLFR